jgi:hypothetical protein
MRFFSGIPALLGLLLLPGCDSGAHHPPPARTTGPAVIRMALPAELGDPERPAVEFDHQLHAKELEQEGCIACHAENQDGRVLPRLKIDQEPLDDDEWMEASHDLCIGCHDERRLAGKSTGADDCGQCHVRYQAPWQDADRQMRFDYSLHFRHSRAYEDKCEACHHVLDEKQNRLVYEKGAEDACNACHLPAAGKDETSLGDAVHIACINCHMQRQGETGPHLCSGCHGEEERAKIEKVKDAPRPDRGQPEAMWMASRGVTAVAVAFDHKLHEAQVDSCSACHHESIGRCAECHTQAPGSDGGGVTLNQASHDPDSTLSCVGCHKERSGQDLCAGCHHVLPVPPAQGSCDLCHSGPPPEREGEAVDRKSLLLAALALRQHAELPPVSADFPEELELEELADKYGPARFPHQKIVAALDRAVRDSRLATRFHQGTNTLCAGCHHRSPPCDPMPACRSCHGDENAAGTDLPELNAAYHRQCIGCHQAIGHEAQGCTDCHQEVRK